MTSDTPDERIPQDPGIPGFDTISEEPDADEQEPGGERDARPDDPDREGHVTAPEDG
jgi:hypothetical protein